MGRGEGGEGGNLGVGQTALTLVNSAVGIGLLGMPYVFKLVGWGALALCALCAAMALSTGLMMARMLEDEASRVKKKRDSVPTAPLGYDVIGRRAFGPAGAAVATALQTAELFMACVAMLVLIGGNCHAASGMARERGILAAAGAMLALCMADTSILSAVSALGLVNIGLEVAVLLAAGVSQPAATRAALAGGRAWLMPERMGGAFGTVMLCFSAHSTIPSIVAGAREPSVCAAALSRAYGAMLAIYAAVGALGYYLFGSELAPSFLDNVPSGAMSLVALTAVTAKLVSTLPLCLGALTDVLVALLPSQAADALGARAVRAACLAGTSIAMVGCAFAFKDLLFTVLQVTGTSVSCLIALIVPVCGYLRSLGHEASAATKLWCAVILLASTALAVTGTLEGIARATASEGA